MTQNLNTKNDLVIDHEIQIYTRIPGSFDPLQNEIESINASLRDLDLQKKSAIGNIRTIKTFRLIHKIRKFFLPI